MGGFVVAVTVRKVAVPEVDPVLADEYRAWGRGPAAAVRRRGGELGQR
ncbi:MAG: hypothetical protein WBA97_28305 [Actinophytocola sp.]